jgi:2-keto-4-pentenoate hydratase/2-oxohepta-3-ene-1,7-dioic acid hydratase in catechol pathway
MLDTWGEPGCASNRGARVRAVDEPLRIVLFGPESRTGAWVDDLVVDLHAASERVPSDLAALIEAGDAGIDAAREAVEQALTRGDEGVTRPLVSTVLRPPAVFRPRIACAANNFAQHTIGSVARRSGAFTAHASGALEAVGMQGGIDLAADALIERTRASGRIRGFWKDFAVPAGPDDDVPYPTGAGLLDYEGEAAVVVGCRAKAIPAERAHEVFWGVTLHNDLSIRPLHAERGDGSVPFNLSKNFERSASVGPAILVGAVAPDDLVVRTHVNGELRQEYHTGDMIFSFGELVELLSRNIVLLPGDMISGGSGAGTALDSSALREGGTVWPDDLERSRFLSVGDVVEVSSPGIGPLRNRIVASA